MGGATGDFCVALARQSVKTNPGKLLNTLSKASWCIQQFCGNSRDWVHSGLFDSRSDLGSSQQRTFATSQNRHACAEKKLEVWGTRTHCRKFSSPGNFPSRLRTQSGSGSGSGSGYGYGRTPERKLCKSCGQSLAGQPTSGEPVFFGQARLVGTMEVIVRKACWAVIALGALSNKPNPVERFMTVCIMSKTLWDHRFSQIYSNSCNLAHGTSFQGFRLTCKISILTLDAVTGK